jgi:protein tyrosine/serine phosphatase
VFASTQTQRRTDREREREKADGNTGLVIKLEPTLSCVRVSRNYYLQISGEERERDVYGLWSWLQQKFTSILALLLGKASCAILSLTADRV